MSRLKISRKAYKRDRILKTKKNLIDTVSISAERVFREAKGLYRSRTARETYLYRNLPAW